MMNVSATSTKSTINALVDDADRRFGARVVWYVPDASGRGFVPRRQDELARERKQIAALLAARGIGRGDRVAIVAPTSGEWVLADLAILSRGAVTVGIYPTSTQAQMRHILAHAKCKAAFFRGDDARAACAAAGIEAFDLDTLPALLASLAPVPVADVVDVEPDDDATIVYTSGTTGEPKGVVLTHRALFTSSRVGVDALGVNERDVGVGFLPLAHALARVNLYGTMHAGPTTWFARSLEEVADVWQAAHPTVLALVPRVLEKIHARILATVAAAPAARQKIFARAIEIGRQRVALVEQGREVPTRLAMEHALYARLVYRRIRAGLGWDRLRFSLCGGAPLRREVAEFFHAVGALILEGYGLTETSAATIVSLPSSWRIGSVGKPLPGVDARIDDDGEILLKSPGLFTRYESDDAATRAAFTDDGYFRTGDVGVRDGDGYLRLTDRKKDLLVTAGGKNVAPQAIEAALLGDPRVTQAVALGDGKPYLVALLVMDPSVPRAERERAAADAVARANHELARFEQIKRWRVLDEELTVASGLLTPTQKVRRRAVAERYARVVDELYAAAPATATAAAA